jgi:hypothetical protein
MLSRAQQILIKRAQREAGLEDGDYRAALQTVSGCSSSRDQKLTDRHCDLVLAYFEAIFWRKVDKGEFQANCMPGAVFRKRGFWAAKNPKSCTSRDRYLRCNWESQINALETELGSLGFGPEYCRRIRARLADHAPGREVRPIDYLAALRRTLRAKQKTLAWASAQAQTIKV